MIISWRCDHHHHIIISYNEVLFVYDLIIWWGFTLLWSNHIMKVNTIMIISYHEGLNHHHHHYITISYHKGLDRSDLWSLLYNHIMKVCSTMIIIIVIPKRFLSSSTQRLNFLPLHPVLIWSNRVSGRWGKYF